MRSLTLLIGWMFGWTVGLVGCCVPLAANIGVYLWGQSLLPMDQCVGINGTCWTALLLTVYLLATGILFMVSAMCELDKK